MTTKQDREASEAEIEQNDYERGPNGFPYADMGRSQVSGWELGEFHLKIRREDGEMLRVNFTPDQFAAMRDAIGDTLTRAAEHEGIDYDGE